MKRADAIKDIAKQLEYRASEITDLFEYLDALQSKGVTNMFGAVPYLMVHNRSLSREAAITVLRGWMESNGK